jgi:mono/diheme cytochrome c family protein
MRQHARAAHTMRAAVIGGQLEEARRAASQIASDEWTPHLQLNYSLYVSAVRSAARAVQTSKSLADAAEGLGELGATCAACHRNVGAPSRSWAVATGEVGNLRMAAHARAEQALWDGLVNSSDASWSSGARELLEAPELDSDDEEMSLLARRTRDQAREAATATSTRGDVYGRIVATCSSCHRLNPRTP